MVHADLSILVHNQVCHGVASHQLNASYKWGYHLRVHCLGVSLNSPSKPLQFPYCDCIPVCLSAEDALLVSVIYFTFGKLSSCTSRHLISHLTRTIIARASHFLFYSERAVLLLILCKFCLCIQFRTQFFGLCVMIQQCSTYYKCF